MAALNLFPARIRFVNDDGTLTLEAYRALQIVFNRVGGALGDTGVDVFGSVFGSPSDAISPVQTDVVQPVDYAASYGDVVQSASIDALLPDIAQQSSDGVFSRLTVSSILTLAGGATLATTSTTLTNGAAAAAGTLLSAPAAGNPTKWIGINDNGTTRYIPAW